MSIPLQIVTDAFPRLEDRLTVVPNSALRISLTSRCLAKCVFCHREGNTEGGDVVAGNPLVENVRLLSRHCRLTRVHLTGGEPTAHPDFPRIVTDLATAGVRLSATTNGHFEASVRESLGALEHVNFSLHDLDGSPFVPSGCRASRLGAHLLLPVGQVLDNLLTVSRQTRVRINCVVYRGDQDLARLYEYAKERCLAFALLASWGFSTQGDEMIETMLRQKGAALTHAAWRFPGSNVRCFYSDEDGFVTEYKRLIPFCLSSMKGRCAPGTTCLEGFAFLRLEGSPLRVRPCIHSASGVPTWPPARFVQTPIATEIRDLIGLAGSFTPIREARQGS